MAITILSTPDTYASLSEDSYFVVSSDNAGLTNFKYVFDIYINSTLITRLKNFPDVNGKGIINVSGVVRNYFSSYFKPNATQTAISYNGNNNYVAYTVQFGEEYASTVYSNLANSSANSYNYYEPMFRDYSASYYSTFSWLTNRDRNNIECLLNGRLYITYRKSGSSSLSLTVKKYTESGTLITSSTGSSTTTGTVTLLDISPQAINTYLGSSFINSDTVLYGVSVNNADEVKVKVVCATRYTPVAVHFLNQLGGYESFTFRLANRKTTNSEKKSYESVKWSINASNQMVRYNDYKVMIGGKQAYALSKTVSFKLVSDILTYTDYNWMNELINSTEIYLEQNGFYYPCIIKTSNWEEKYKTDRQNNFISIEVDVLTNNSQFR